MNVTSNTRTLSHFVMQEGAVYYVTFTFSHTHK